MSRSTRTAAVVAAAALVAVSTAAGATANEPAPHETFRSAQATAVTVESESAALADVEGYDGVQVHAEVADPSQEMTAVFDLEGGRFIEGNDGGIVALDGNDDYLFVVLPEVVDAAGQAVDASVEASGETVSVDLDAADESAYPLDVSVMAVSDLVAKVTKTTTSQGARFKVQPSAYGRAAPTAIHMQWGWPEAKRKGVWNYASMQQQYICHPMSAVARVKSTWNLESWRPVVSAATLVKTACNPK